MLISSTSSMGPSYRVFLDMDSLAGSHSRIWTSDRSQMDDSLTSLMSWIPAAYLVDVIFDPTLRLLFNMQHFLYITSESGLSSALPNRMPAHSLFRHHSRVSNSRSLCNMDAFLSLYWHQPKSESSVANEHEDPPTLLCRRHLRVLIPDR